MFKIPDMIGPVKGSASKFMKKLGVPDFIWQEGYGVFTADVTSYNRLKNYIKNQEEHQGFLWLL